MRRPKSWSPGWEDRVFCEVVGPRESALGMPVFKSDIRRELETLWTPDGLKELYEFKPFGSIIHPEYHNDLYSSFDKIGFTDMYGNFRQFHQFIDSSEKE